MGHDGDGVAPRDDPANPGDRAIIDAPVLVVPRRIPADLALRVLFSRAAAGPQRDVQGVHRGEAEAGGMDGEQLRIGRVLAASGVPPGTQEVHPGGSLRGVHQPHLSPTQLRTVRNANEPVQVLLGLRERGMPRVRHGTVLVHGTPPPNRPRSVRTEEGHIPQVCAPDVLHSRLGLRLAESSGGLS